MDFENTFTVKAPIGEVYEAMLDLDRVAPAMPGAQVLGRTDDGAYKVAIKVKLGPVSITYRGEVSIVERDPDAHTAVLDVKAKEARGQGTATAKVNLSLADEGGETRGTMKAHVQLSGKAAAMGRGVIEDVSKKLVGTFADNLAKILESEPAAGEPASAEEPAASAGEEAASGNGGGTGAGRAEQPSPRAAPSQPASQSTSNDDDGLAALPLAAGVLADRLRDPRVLGGVLGGAVLLGYLLGRRSG